MAVAGVGGSGAVGGQLLEALDGDGAKVTGEGGVLRQHDGALGHEAVNQRLLAAAHGARSRPATDAAERERPSNRRRHRISTRFTRGSGIKLNR